jgi:RNA polymerase sigma-70 factor (ECF subfamily)
MRSEDCQHLEERFRSIFELHYSHIQAYARRRCADAADADDVVAETFTIAWRRLDDVPAEPLPWLYGVARRVLANQRRGRRRWLALLDRLRREPADVPTPNDASEPVMVALSRLRPPDQELLRLSAWEGLGPSEIAAALGITANAASIRLHRARNQLAAELAALGMAPRNAGAGAGQSIG